MAIFIIPHPDDQPTDLLREESVPVTENPWKDWRVIYPSEEIMEWFSSHDINVIFYIMIKIIYDDTNAYDDTIQPGSFVFDIPDPSHATLFKLTWL